MNNVLQEGITTLTALVEKFRELARDLLRMRWINNVKDVILGIECSIKACNESIAHYTKLLARANYAISKLDEADPDYADKKANQDELLKDYSEVIEGLNKDLVKLGEDKAKEEKKISDIETGVLKVNAENLSAKAKELAESYTKFQASQVK